MVITETQIRFEDTYSTIHVRAHDLKELGLKVPCTVDKEKDPETYKTLDFWVDEVNIFKPRDEVPNKKITTDIPGMSKLVRAQDKSRITLCFRAKRKDGTRESSAKSCNTCFISETDAFECQANFFLEQTRYGNNCYYIVPGHPLFDYWSDHMDQEYARLAGIKYQRKSKPVEARKSWSEMELEDAHKCLDAYAATDIGTDLDIIKALAEAGYCKINDRGTSLYNKHGYWLCHLEEFIERDANAQLLKWILCWLRNGELGTAKRIIEKFIKEEK